jgi:ubiquinone/menaquinone biosynthesis C-methylase UbiE
VTFDVPAAAYDRFMGRYSVTLSPQLADLAGIAPGRRVLDVGCGSGMLTAELVRRAGADAVAAVDPSEAFVEAMRERHPGVDVHRGVAERLPFADGEFHAALAQLVVHFMTDPVAGLREMARVTRPGGVVVASVWDLVGGRSPISPFWIAARNVDPRARTEMAVRGGRQGDLLAILTEAGLRDVTETEHPAVVEHPTFADWWEPFTLGVGPAGNWLVAQDEARQEQVRAACHELLGDGPFSIPSFAWAARGVV